MNDGSENHRNLNNAFASLAPGIRFVKHKQWQEDPKQKVMILPNFVGIFSSFNQ